jgi:hypothetical protein
MGKGMILWIVCFLFNRKREQEDSDEQNDEVDLLCRFVLDGNGRTVGESVAIQNDVLIVKDKNDFLGVPLKHVEETGKKLLVKGLVDTSKAKELGEAWRDASYEEIVMDEED